MKSKEKAKNEWDFLGIKTDRISWYASILAYFAIALTLAVYLFKFGPASGFSLSSQQSVWAEFGDFFWRHSRPVYWVRLDHASDNHPPPSEKTA